MENEINQHWDMGWVVSMAQFQFMAVYWLYKGYVMSVYSVYGQ